MLSKQISEDDILQILISETRLQKCFDCETKQTYTSIVGKGRLINSSIGITSDTSHRADAIDVWILSVPSNIKNSVAEISYFQDSKSEMKSNLSSHFKAKFYVQSELFNQLESALVSKLASSIKVNIGADDETVGASILLDNEGNWYLDSTQNLTDSIFIDGIISATGCGKILSVSWL